MSRLNNPRYAPPKVLARNLVATNQVWVLEGLCRDQSPMWDSSAKPEVKARAMRICRDCPVFDLCEQAGRDEVYGIWAGVDKKTPAAPVKNPRVPKPPRKPMSQEEKLAKAAEASRIARAASLADFLAEVEHLANTGASLEQVCDALGKTSNALRQRLRVNGRNDLIVTLINNRRQQKAAS